MHYVLKGRIDDDPYKQLQRKKNKCALPIAIRNKFDELQNELNVHFNKQFTTVQCIHTFILCE